MKFTLTAGHSNQDPGAVSQGITEAGLARELRNILASKLKQKGHTVRTDGTGDTNYSLTQAMKLIAGSDVALELHFNAASPQAKGVETIAQPKDRKLAQKISQAVADVLATSIRGDAGWIDQSQSARKRLGYVAAGGLIVEVCFITNQTELAAYQAKKWLVASAIAEALDDWSKR